MESHSRSQPLGHGADIDLLRAKRKPMETVKGEKDCLRYILVGSSHRGAVVNESD